MGLQDRHGSAFRVSYLLRHQVTLENRSARPQAYAVKRELKATTAGKTMIWTGLAVALFIIIIFFISRCGLPIRTSPRAWTRWAGPMSSG
jgi:hypothetical protein